MRVQRTKRTRWRAGSLMAAGSARDAKVTALVRLLIEAKYASILGIENESIANDALWMVEEASRIAHELAGVAYPGPNGGR